MHARVLEAAGSRGVSEGTHLKVTVEDSPRGQQVSQVLEIGDQVAKIPAKYLAGESFAGTGAQLESEGTVKWYNPEKGFGFIAPAKRREGHLRSCHRAGPFRAQRAGWRDRRCLSNARRARKAWKCGAFASPKQTCVASPHGTRHKDHVLVSRPLLLLTLTLSPCGRMCLNEVKADEGCGTAALRPGTLRLARWYPSTDLAALGHAG